MTEDPRGTDGTQAGTDNDALTPDRAAGLRSGDRAAVREAISGLPRSTLAAYLETPDGEAVLRDAFDRMPAFYIGGVLDRTVTARWEVTRSSAATIEVDLELSPHGCTIHLPPSEENPTVALVLDAISFVELASATRPGMELLLQGRLHIRGDVQLAMRMESLFGLGPGSQAGR
jgi:hypothetical protein